MIPVDSHSLRLQDVVDLPMLQALLERLNGVHRFPSAIIDNDGHVLVAAGWQDVCAKFHRVHPECARDCEASNGYVRRHVHDARPAITHTCPHGLIEAAVPIMVGGRHLASFFTGQVFLAPPDLDFFRREALRYGFDEAAYLEAVQAVDVCTRETLDRHLLFIKGLTELIAGMAERQLEEQRTRAEILALSDRLQLATESAGAGVWDWNLVTGEMTWDARMHELYGTNPECFTGGVEAWEQALDPADRDRAIAECQAALGGLRDFNTEFRVRRPDGTVIVVKANGLVVRDHRRHGAPVRMIGLNSDITSQKRAERELRRSRESLSLALRSSEMGVWRFDFVANRREFDDLVCHCLGIDRSTFRGTAEEFYGNVHPDDRAGITAALQEAIRTRTPYEVEYRVVWPDGSLHHIASRARVVVDGAGRPQAVHGVLWDVTERRRKDAEHATLEARLQHAQKMESVGRLAGGVAHDFNNMLSVILGNCAMALKSLAPGQPLFGDLVEIQQAAERAAGITRQLLAFARRQTIAPRVVNLNDVVSGTLKMLSRLIGEDIALQWQPGPELWSVKIDPAQVDQVLANLCVNARDAIDGVGQVTVATANATVNDADGPATQGFPLAEGLLPGEYVKLSLSDSGCGIDQDTLAMVFDPFFTTKPLGRGTGLGLATVYGIVRQNGGVVSVYSQPKEGTTFTIYLPRAEKPAETTVTAPGVEQPRGGSETILLVEDEPSILKLTARILRQLEYQVLIAPTPGEAIRLTEERAPGTIQLLLTDVVMPEMNGLELAERISAVHPGIKCLFTSGYPADVIAHRGALDEGVVFLKKPFLPEDLASKVRTALDGQGHSGSY